MPDQTSPKITLSQRSRKDRRRNRQATRRGIPSGYSRNADVGCGEWGRQFGIFRAMSCPRNRLHGRFGRERPIRNLESMSDRAKFLSDPERRVRILSIPRSIVSDSIKSKCSSAFWRGAYSNADCSNQLTNCAREFRG
jgi:hypothetical protein